MSDDIRVNISEGKYVIPSPPSQIYTYICICKRVYDVPSINKQNHIPNFCSDCGDKIKDKIKELSDRNHTIGIEHQENRKRIKELFKKDLFESFGLRNHPKAEKIYAYVMRDETRYEDIINKMEELMEIIL